MKNTTWKYEPETKTIRSEPGNHWIATMDSWDGAVNNEDNARLIAAAPELLDALKEILDTNKTSPGDILLAKSCAEIAISKTKETI